MNRTYTCIGYIGIIEQFIKTYLNAVLFWTGINMLKYVLNIQKALSWKLYQTPVTAYICLYQEINLKIVEYTSSICWFLVAEYLRTLGAEIV